MVKLKAIKPHKYPRGTYGTRHMVGDVYEAKPRDARLLVATKKAALAPADVAPTPQAAEPEAPLAEDNTPAPRSLDDLRAEAEALGITVDRRWGVRRLEQEIEAARG